MFCTGDSRLAETIDKLSCLHSSRVHIFLDQKPNYSLDLQYIPRHNINIFCLWRPYLERTYSDNCCLSALCNFQKECPLCCEYLLWYCFICESHPQIINELWRLVNGSFSDSYDELLQVRFLWVLSVWWVQRWKTTFQRLTITTDKRSP